MQFNIKISDKPLLPQPCIDWVTSPDCGGINVFIGSVRNHTKGRNVIRLEFEAYESMALIVMNKIADDASKRWHIGKILIHHRIGSLQIGEIPVIIAVSSAHRDTSFEGCRYIIEKLKETVPIWKKEYYEDGEIWVAAHP